MDCVFMLFLKLFSFILNIVGLYIDPYVLNCAVLNSIAVDSIFHFSGIYGIDPLLVQRKVPFPCP